ncbi:MAG: zf-TFIIB domain-containing protein [Myxococcota bacterium]|nr:zf-TFIIB domain-containing protein [Myxococcota bacterium]
MASPEEEYFARLEAEKKARLAAILEDEEAKVRAEEVKALHYLHCGKCGQEMITTHFKGVEIEVCPACGAVLLDPGELQQLAGEDRSRLLTSIAGVFGFDASASSDQ